MSKRISSTTKDLLAPATSRRRNASQSRSRSRSPRNSNEPVSAREAIRIIRVLTPPPPPPTVIDTPPASDVDTAIVVRDDTDDSDDERLPILDLGTASNFASRHPAHAPNATHAPNRQQAQVSGAASATASNNRPPAPTSNAQNRRINHTFRGGQLRLPIRPEHQPIRRNETPEELARQLGEFNRSLADHQCAICQDVLKEPVNLPCGVNISHTVCKSDILELKKNHPNCPLCRTSLHAWLSNVSLFNASDFVNVARHRTITQTQKRIRLTELKLARARAIAKFDEEIAAAERELL